MKHFGTLLFLMTLPVLAQDAPPPPALAAPAVQAAPAPSPLGASALGTTSLATQVAQQRQAGALMVPVLEGDTQVVLSQGTYDSEAMHMSGASYVPLVGLFAGSVKQPLKVVGEYSESKAPAHLKRIALTGYSPKSMGQFGTLLVCKCKVDEGNRYLRTSDLEMEKTYYKSVNEVVKLTQTPEGAWGFEVKGALEAGHYVVTFLKNPIQYWDFDVK